MPTRTGWWFDGVDVRKKRGASGLTTVAMVRLVVLAGYEQKEAVLRVFS